MSTLFIADLHLSEVHPEIIQEFYSFLRNNTSEVDALYILGDLFEVWIGDDEQTPLMVEVAKKLTQYSMQNGIPIFYIHGNRDFLIGEKYAKQSSMQLLPEHHVINLYGKKVLLMHGDTLCLADKNYQKMRKVLHNTTLQLVFNCLPLYFRRKIGRKIRTASQSQKVYKNDQIMGVTQSEVERLLIQHDCQTLIHGHTHHVAKHQFNINNKQYLRFDVGDWFKSYSYIEANDKHVKLHVKQIN